MDWPCQRYREPKLSEGENKATPRKHHTKMALKHSAIIHASAISKHCHFTCESTNEIKINKFFFTSFFTKTCKFSRGKDSPQLYTRVPMENVIAFPIPLYKSMSRPSYLKAGPSYSRGILKPSATSGQLCQGSTLTNQLHQGNTPTNQLRYGNTPLHQGSTPINQLHQGSTTNELQYRPVTTAHTRVIFRVVLLVFIVWVNWVQIHAWFWPTATRGSQRGYKYYHACVAKAVFHAWVVLIATIAWLKPLYCKWRTWF